MVGVCVGVDLCKDARGAATADGAWTGVGGSVFAAVTAAEITKDCGSQFADGISGMDRAAAACGDERHDAQSGMDGGGVRAIPEIFEGEYSAERSAGRA